MPNTTPLPNKIDELATICELWQARRQKSQPTLGIQAAVIALSTEISIQAGQHNQASGYPAPNFNQSIHTRGALAAQALPNKPVKPGEE